MGRVKEYYGDVIELRHEDMATVTMRMEEWRFDTLIQQFGGLKDILIKQHQRTPENFDKNELIFVAKQLCLIEETLRAHAETFEE